jgi:phosphoglycerate dehydrogenase-like enzyme
MTTALPLIALGPTEWPLAAEAIAAGGGRLAPVEEAEALVWVDWHGVEGLGQVLSQAPGIRWVHLPGAGIEEFVDAGLMADGRLWTCSKGAHSALIAEHALALALAGVREIPASARTREWEPKAGGSLLDRPVTIIGGGGIATALIGLLAPFRSRITVVRRQSQPVAGADRTLTPDAMADALPEARLVVLALALTAETRHIVGAAELELMHERAWLVNVSRGGHIDTDALVDALRRNAIGGAALDVTEPEPLPPGHPLWSLPNCLVTPHIAGNSAAVMRALAQRIGDNVRRFGAGEPLIGVVDTIAGY